MAKTLISSQKITVVKALTYVRIVVTACTVAKIDKAKDLAVILSVIFCLLKLYFLPRKIFSKRVAPHFTFTYHHLMKYLSRFHIYTQLVLEIQLHIFIKFIKLNEICRQPRSKRPPYRLV